MEEHLTNSDQTPGSFSQLGNPCCNEANTAVSNVDALDLRAPGETRLRAREIEDGTSEYDMRSSFAADGFEQESPKPSSRVQALPKLKLHYWKRETTDGTARTPRFGRFWMKPE
jgi:hypothetical protein